MNFNCSLCAYENKNNNGWVYALQVLPKRASGKNISKNECLNSADETISSVHNCLFEIYSQKSYTSYKDALQDGYGILEYLGFVIQDKNIRVQFNISSWNNELQQFVEGSIYFDGFDFFETPSS